MLWVFICGLRYTTRNAHALYCHLWPVRLYHIFPHYLIYSTNIETKKVTELKVYFEIFPQLLYEKWIVLSRTDWDVIKRYRYSGQSLMNLEFSRQSLEKFWNMKFNENPSDRSWVVVYGKKDGRNNSQEEMSKLTFAFSNFVSAPKNVNKQVTAFSIELHCYFEIGRKYPL